MRYICLFLGILFLTGCMLPSEYLNQQYPGYGGHVRGHANPITVVDEHNVEEPNTLNSVYNCERYYGEPAKWQICVDETKVDNNWKRSEYSKSNAAKFRVYEKSANPQQNYASHGGIPHYDTSPCGFGYVFLGFNARGWPICESEIRLQRRIYNQHYYQRW